MMQVQTLLYVLDRRPSGQVVLLGRKRRGFGRGKIMAPGGHVEPGETVVAAAIREADEEVGVQVEETDATLVAALTYRFPSKPVLDAEVHAFVARIWSGAIRASDELEPLWFPVSALPLDLMWDDERYWLPRVLDGERLAAEIVYDEACEQVVTCEIRWALSAKGLVYVTPCA